MLGGEHFLLHKIWSFKINSTGERTDLVLETKISEKDDLLESVNGLVLTEWKVADQNDVEAKINEAITQANKYALGSLYSTDLRKYRYIVIVSKKNLGIGNYEREENGNVYKIINIAYNPDSPSIGAKKK